MLLSGAIAYYTLLSVVPLFILSLIVMTHVVKEEQLFQAVSIHLEMVIPAYAQALAGQVKTFLEHREIIGLVGVLVLLFFSSLAFTALENAMSVIFSHRVRMRRRHFLISAVIPYIYILLLGLGMLLVSFIAGALEVLEGRSLAIFGFVVGLEGSAGVALYLIGVAGEVLMLTSLYLVMPVGRITFRHAFVGGVTATFLWEITRHVLIWYYATLSFVNLIYGSLATTVVALLSFEVAALILLLGAQVIAEFERGSGGQGDRRKWGFGA